MATFTDKNGKEHSFELNLATMEDIDNYDFSKVTDLEVSMLTLQKEDSWEIFTRPLVMAEIVWATMAHDTDVTRREFFSSLHDDSLRELQKAFFTELGNFFPRLATFFSKLVSQAEKMQKKSNAELDRLLVAMSEQLTVDAEETERKMEELADQTIAEARSSTPASSQT